MNTIPIDLNPAPTPGTICCCLHARLCQRGDRIQIENGMVLACEFVLTSGQDFSIVHGKRYRTTHRVVLVGPW